MWLPLLMSFLPVLQLTSEQQAKAIVWKAIQASGKERAARYQGFRRKGTGYALMDGKPRAITIEARVRYPDMTRQEIWVETPAGTLSFAKGLQGRRGWMSSGQAVADAEGAELAGMVEAAYASDAERLIPLVSGRSFLLAVLPPSTVKGRDVLGVRVSKESHRDLELYFDPSSGLMVKTARVRTRLDGTEAKEEIYYLGYQDFNGVKVPTVVQILDNGVTYCSYTVKEFEWLETMDEHAFDKPSYENVFGPRINWYDGAGAPRVPRPGAGPLSPPGGRD